MLNSLSLAYFLSKSLSQRMVPTTVSLLTFTSISKFTHTDMSTGKHNLDNALKSLHSQALLGNTELITKTNLTDTVVLRHVLKDFPVRDSHLQFLLGFLSELQASLPQSILDFPENLTCVLHLNLTNASSSVKFF